LRTCDVSGDRFLQQDRLAGSRRIRCKIRLDLRWHREGHCLASIEEPSIRVHAWAP